jgi:ABC-2 type transport system ATP-binding protein
MDVVTMRAVGKHFGPVTALTDIDLSVRAGELVAILGSNGAGKSTLLRILGTAVLPDEGEATVAGHNVAREAAAVRRAIGFMLPDERSWYWRLSGRHNLEFFAALNGLRRAGAAERADELLREVGLEQAADRRFDGYSSGMRVRLSLARALISRPPVLLLDEPTRSIDPVGRKHFRELLTAVAERSETSVLVATHDLHEAAELATRSVVLSYGRLSAIVDEWRDAADLERRLLEAS